MPRFLEEDTVEKEDTKINRGRERSKERRCRD